MWQRHRTAPASALLAATLIAVVGVTLLVLWQVYVVRGSTGLPPFTAGLPEGSLAQPLQRRAFYLASLVAKEPRETPAGTRAAAYRWAVVVAAAPDDPLCGGTAEEGLALQSGEHLVPLVLPIPRGFFQEGTPREVPPRLLATCAAAAEREASALRYLEEYVPDGVEVVVAACASRSGEETRLGGCEDAAPTPIYRRETAVEALHRVRLRLVRVVVIAVVFSSLCGLVGLLAMHRWLRRERA